MDVGLELGSRQAPDVVMRQAKRVFNESIDAQVPCGQIHARDAAVMEHGPFLGQVLSGRESVCDRLFATI